MKLEVRLCFQLKVCEALTASVAVFGDGDSGEVIMFKWGHKGGVLIW